MCDERRLHRMQHVALRHALDRVDMRAVTTERESEARIDPSAVDQHRTRAALPTVATLLGAGQSSRSRRRSSSVTRGSSNGMSRAAPFTVSDIDKLMRCSDQCYRRTGSQLTGPPIAMESLGGG